MPKPETTNFSLDDSIVKTALEFEDLPSVWLKVRSVLRSAMLENDIDLEDAGFVIVAIELVLAASGHPNREMPASLLLRVGRRPADLEELRRLCNDALHAVQKRSELGELIRPAGLARCFRELRGRLDLPLVLATQGHSSRKRPKVQRGDVFQIAVPDGTFSYGRVIGPELYCIYKERSSQVGRPPIGSREYLLVAKGLYDAVFTKGSCSVVGRDEWSEDEPHSVPRFFSCAYPFFAKVAAPEYKRIPATVEECFGLPKFVESDLPGVIDAILEGEDGPTQSFLKPVLPDSDGTLRKMKWEEWDRAIHKRWDQFFRDMIRDDRSGFFRLVNQAEREVNVQFREFYRKQPFNAGRPDDDLLTFADVHKIGLW